MTIGYVNLKANNDHVNSGVSTQLYASIRGKNRPVKKKPEGRGMRVQR